MTFRTSLRHALAGALLAGLGLSGLAPAIAQAAAPQVRTQAPGFYRMMLGDFEITALSDGTVPQHMDRELQGAAPGQVEALFAGAHQTLPVETSINAFLINTGKQLLLVDTGAGHAFGPHVANRLVSNLKAAGYRPDQVDAVLLTHVHADHSGGLTLDGQPVFPKARVYLDRRELDYWSSDEARERAPAQKKPWFAAGRASLAPYAEAGRLRTFSAPAALFAGVTALTAPGHTPGHSIYALESRGQKLVFWGDLVHAGEVQFPVPSITISYDSDGPAAARQRLAAFADASQKGYWVAAPHISFPGLGHVVTDGAAYRWLPAPYSLAVEAR
ncbi:MBL fold metallo-hydrolase [Pseudomonas sp. RIT-PI-AD]|uniref:MBL fold metallo-hydrolase n=1 Tax=Pseudomonas sp. RIT-PI-AD TaxID=3035294 RepID=UPI0021D97733|nr:MBL fold metallo-hydrolase [Pseudomonas sp. RIT-PI-AD]